MRIHLGTRSSHRAPSYRQAPRVSRALILLTSAAIGSSFTIMSLPWAPALADVDLFPSTTVSAAPGTGHMNADKKAEIVVEGAEFAPEEHLPNQTPAATLDELDPEPTPQGDPSIGDFTGHEGQTWVESHAVPSANATSIQEIDQLKVWVPGALLEKTPSISSSRTSLSTLRSSNVTVRISPEVTRISGVERLESIVGIEFSSSISLMEVALAEGIAWDSAQVWPS